MVDLGAAPGGWSQVAAARVDSSDAAPLVVAIDYLGMDPLPGVVVLEKDFLDPDAPDLIKLALGGEKADVVLSDMAAPTTGHRQTDHIRIVALCEAAADFARDVLKPGGAFLAKVFRGGTENTLLAGAEARLRQGAAREAAGKPLRQPGALSARDRVQGRPEVAGILFRMILLENRSPLFGMMRGLTPLAHDGHRVRRRLAAGHLVAGVAREEQERHQGQQRERADQDKGGPERACLDRAAGRARRQSRA